MRHLDRRALAALLALLSGGPCLPAYAQNLLRNGGFRRDTLDWARPGEDLAGSPRVSWSRRDGRNDPASGSARILVDGGDRVEVLRQPVALEPDTAYELGALAFLPAEPLATGRAAIVVHSYPEACDGAIRTDEFPVETAAGTWVPVRATFRTPSSLGCPSLGVVAVREGGPGPFEIQLDDVWIRKAGAFEYVVPGIAKSGGLGGASWRSDLELLNPGTGAVEATLRFHGSSPPRDAVVSLEGRGQVTIEDVVSSLFGLEGNVAGFLRVEATGLLEVRARTYSLARDGCGDVEGRFGQSFRGLAPEEGLEGSRVGLLAGLKSRGARTNLEIVNPGPETATVEVSVYGDRGGLAAERLVRVVEPNGRAGITELLPPDLPSAWAAVRVEPEEAAVFALASVIDTGSNDPVLVLATPGESRSTWRLEGAWNVALTATSPGSFQLCDTTYSPDPLPSSSVLNLYRYGRIVFFGCSDFEEWGECVEAAGLDGNRMTGSWETRGQVPCGSNQRSVVSRWTFDATVESENLVRGSIAVEHVSVGEHAVEERFVSTWSLVLTR